VPFRLLAKIYTAGCFVIVSLDSVFTGMTSG